MFDRVLNTPLQFLLQQALDVYQLKVSTKLFTQNISSNPVHGKIYVILCWTCLLNNENYNTCFLANTKQGLQEQVVKGSSDFMEGSSSLNVTALSGLVAMGIVAVGMFSVYRLALRGKVFKRLCNFMGGSLS